MTQLGRQLAETRKQRGWTLRDAERASGVPNAHISQIETGAIVNPGPAIVARLTRAYGIAAPVPPAALAAAAKAVPFVNRDAMRRIIEAAAPYIQRAERNRIRKRLAAEIRRLDGESLSTAAAVLSSMSAVVEEPAVLCRSQPDPERGPQA